MDPPEAIGADAVMEFIPILKIVPKELLFPENIPAPTDNIVVFAIPVIIDDPEETFPIKYE